MVYLQNTQYNMGMETHTYIWKDYSAFPTILGTVQTIKFIMAKVITVKVVGEIIKAMVC